MLFDVWGSDTLIHWAGWAMVFIGLIVLNEVGRRTKLGAAIIFGVAPLAMTILLRRHRRGRFAGCRVGAHQPHPCVPEQLVPLRQGIRGARRLLGLHCH